MPMVVDPLLAILVMMLSELARLTRQVHGIARQQDGFAGG